MGLCKYARLARSITFTSTGGQLANHSALEAATYIQYGVSVSVEESMLGSFIHSRVHLGAAADGRYIRGERSMLVAGSLVRGRRAGVLEGRLVGGATTEGRRLVMIRTVIRDCLLPVTIM